jgi:hypothetical protein
VSRFGIVVAVLAAALLAQAASPSATATASGLRGKVTLYPARPVCVEDEPCSKPAPGALLVFRRDGRVAARVTTTKEATYRVLLAPGAYTVSAPAYRHGSGVTPHTVRVRKGLVARVDLEIDTGIQ